MRRHSTQNKRDKQRNKKPKKNEKKEKLYKLLPQREDLQEILMKMEKDKLLRLCEDSVELAK